MIIRNMSDPESKTFWDKLIKASKLMDKECESAKLLSELNIPVSATAFVDLLKDEKRLKEVLTKLKNKTFW